MGIWALHAYIGLTYNILKLYLILLNYFQPLPFSIVIVPYQVVLTLHNTYHAHQVESNKIKQFTPVYKMISNY